MYAPSGDPIGRVEEQSDSNTGYSEIVYFDASQLEVARQSETDSAEYDSYQFDVKITAGPNGETIDVGGKTQINIAADTSYIKETYSSTQLVAGTSDTDREVSDTLYWEIDYYGMKGTLLGGMSTVVDHTVSEEGPVECFLLWL